MRLKYTYKFAASQKVEFFLDVFNVLDKQSATASQWLVAGTASTSLASRPTGSSHAACTLARVTRSDLIR